MRISRGCAKGALLLMLALTHSSVVLAQIAPSLGQAESFSVLAGSAVTNTGPTVLIGDLGVNPGTAVSGFPPGIISSGTLHVNDAVALGAQNDATAAYNTLAGEASDADLTGQDLGGMTLVSGVYTFSSSAQLTGTLTLDAQGDPAAVFVFQIGSTLTTASNAQVVIINGGTNCNVFWQVGSSATLGTATDFIGNILALTSITLTTGVNVSGRALARNGAVTLDSNTIEICGVCGAVTIAPVTLPTAVSGVAYTQALTASGGTAPYTFSMATGSLPAGMMLATNGLISGTPTATGSFTFTVRVTDSQGCQAERIFTLVVNAPGCPAIVVSPPTLPVPILGTPYSGLISVTGGTAPYSFAVAGGALPPGLVLGPATGSTATVSGTPSQAGPYTYTVVVTDAAGCLGTITYSGTVSVTMEGIPLPILSRWSLLALISLVAAGVFLRLRGHHS